MDTCSSEMLMPIILLTMSISATSISSMEVLSGTLGLLCQVSCKGIRDASHNSPSIYCAIADAVGWSNDKVGGKEIENLASSALRSSITLKESIPISIRGCMTIPFLIYVKKLFASD